MANWSGISATLQAVFRPSILQPALKVPSIASLDFARFKERGVTGVVLDKDNCITRPRVDELEPTLQPAWDQLLKTFGASNVLIVSNSAGTGKDSLLLQAETVSRNLLVPVLVHPTPKPGHKCVQAVATHFLPSSSSLPARAAVVWSPRARARASAVSAERNEGHASPLPTRIDRPRILVIGDRVTTDMILAQRLNKLVLGGSESDGKRVEAISVLTTTLHAREGLGTTFLRSLEKVALWGLDRRRRRAGAVKGEEDWSDCLRAAAVPSPPSAALPSPLPPSARSSVPWITFTRQAPFITFPSFSLPRFLASLHEPLARITLLWTSSSSRSSVSPSTTSRAATIAWTPTHQWSTLFSRESGTVGIAERAIEGSERAVKGLKQRVGMRV